MAAAFGTVMATLFFLAAGGMEAFGLEAVPFSAAFVAALDGNSLAGGSAGGRIADRLGHGAHFGAVGGGGDLLRIEARLLDSTLRSNACAFFWQ